MTIRDTEPSAPPQHFDISATPAGDGTITEIGYGGESEIAVGPTAYATAVHDDDDTNVPIVHATSLPLGDGPEEAPQQQQQQQQQPFSDYSSTIPGVAVMPQSPNERSSVAVVTGAPPPLNPLPPGYTPGSSGTRRTDGEKCCVITAGVAGAICCVCCVLPFIVALFAFIFSAQQINEAAFSDDDDFFTSLDDDFFNNDNVR